MTVDPDGDDISYQFEITTLYGSKEQTVQSYYPSSELTLWSCYYPSAVPVLFLLSLSEGEYSLRARARDTFNGISEFSDSLMLNFVAAPLYTPDRPSGSASVLAGIPADYETCAQEPDGDDVSFRFDPGDRSGYSPWSPPQSYTYRHFCYHYSYTYAYPHPGSFEMRVQARDDGGNVSGWSSALAIDVMGNIETVGICDVEGGVQAVAAASGYAYISGWANGLQVVDVSDPTAPHVIGSIGDFSAIEIDCREDIVVLVTNESFGENDLVAYDVSSPPKPIETDRERLSDVECFDLENDLAVIGTGSFEKILMIFDVGNPDTIEMLATLDLGEIVDVAISVDYAYVIVDDLWNSMLVIVSVADPRMPSTVGEVTISAWGFGSKHVCIGPGACVYTWADDTLSAVSVYDPADPRVVSKTPVRASVTDMHCRRNHLALVYGNDGVDLYDVANPDESRLIGGSHTAGNCVAVWCGDDVMYVGDGTGRLLVFSYPPRRAYGLRMAETPNLTRRGSLLGNGELSVIPPTTVQNAGARKDGR